jgi:hypothetical protein
MRCHEEEAVHDLETCRLIGRNMTIRWSSRFRPVTILAGQRGPRQAGPGRRVFGLLPRVRIGPARELRPGGRDPDVAYGLPAAAHVGEPPTKRRAQGRAKKGACQPRAGFPRIPFPGWSPGLLYGAIV